MRCSEFHDQREISKLESFEVVCCWGSREKLRPAEESGDIGDQLYTQVAPPDLKFVLRNSNY